MESTTIPAPGWDFYKSEIERLYVVEDKTRDEVMDFMATVYSWKKSRTQYSRKFKEWGLRKHSRPRDDRWIAWKVEKRKRNNKKSEVFINGIQIHPAKLIKSSYRKGFMTESSLHGSPPSTPEGYLVATPPAAPGLQLLWNTSLPWTRFMSLILAPQIDDVSLSSTALLPLNSSLRGNASDVTTGFELMKRLCNIVPWNELRHPQEIYSASRTSAALSILVPENKVGEHDILSKDLSTSRAGFRQHMSVLLYLISNNLTRDYDDDPFMEQQDDLVLQILKDTGWNDSDHLKALLAIREPTAEAIAERLFAAAVRTNDFDLVEIMLQSGMNPNEVIEHYVENFDETFFTPLQIVSTSEKDSQHINLLISYGADVNFSIGDDGKTALYYAIWMDNDTAITVLLSHRAEVTQKCASVAAGEFKPDSHIYIRLIQFHNVLDIYLDQDVERQRDETGTLKRAVERNNVPVIESFLSRGAKLNGASCSIYLTPYSVQGRSSLLGLAAKQGFIEIVRLLLHVPVREDSSSDSRPYVSPLALAVERGSTEISELLLRSGANVRDADEGENTLLERAVRHNDLPLCQLLIDHGARVDREPGEFLARQSALILAVQQGLVDIVDYLISSNARLNDEFHGSPGTILGAAIQAGHQAIIHNLIKAGATRVGYRIQRIGNLATALYLQKNGFLPSLLSRIGPGLLAAAISAEDDSLAWFLLQNCTGDGQEMTLFAQWKPLCAALHMRNLAFVFPFLELGAKVTDCALTEAIKDNVDLLPMLLARFKGSAPTAVAAAVLKNSMISLELMRGANVDMRGVPRMAHHEWNIARASWIQDHGFQSALEIAVWWDDDVILKYLLDWASSVQMYWSPESVSRALTIAIFKRKQDCIMELMELGSDFNYDVTNHGYFLPGGHGLETFSPLQAAVKTQQVSIVRQLLVSRRVDVNYLGEGELRRTPLQHAVELGNMEIVNLLLEHGADVNAPAADDGGATALQIVAIKGYIGIARRLLDLGADVNEDPAFENGRTALMGAAEYGRIDMMQMLLDEGASVVGYYELYYYEAVELAESRGHHAAARLLKSFKESVELCTS